MTKIERSIRVPVWEKMNLTLEEAAAYTGVGICKLRELSNEQKCNFVLRVGSKRLLKRKELEDYLNKVSSV
ncbi:MAG: excisionase [Acutalibacteraceae bacterium]|nr:excisionase [Acutalibacteraceae bacterium]